MNKYLAEAFGTFLFVLAVAGSILANNQTGGSLGVVGIALVHAFALTAIIYSIGHISGGHVNPAISIAQALTGHLKPLVALGYVASQLIGAIGAALVVKFLFAGVSAQLFLGDTMLGTNVSPLTGLLAEALFTFALSWVVYGAAVSKKETTGFGPLAIGMTLGVAVLVIGHISGASLNPARSFGTALVSVHWENHFIYWVGPLLGAIVAGVLQHFLIEKSR